MLEINNYDLRLILVLSDYSSDVYYRMIYVFVKRWSVMSKELNFIGINLCIIIFRIFFDIFKNINYNMYDLI